MFINEESFSITAMLFQSTVSTSKLVRGDNTLSQNINITGTRNQILINME